MSERQNCQLSTRVDAENAVRARFDWNETTPTAAIVETVAEASECSSLELPKLYPSINPDSIDSLFPTGPVDAPSNCSLTFDYAGHTVTVTSTGMVEVASTGGRSS